MKMESKTTVESLAIELFQSGYEIINNRDSSFALVTKGIKTRPTQVFITIKFFVYEYSSGEKIHSETLPQGKVEWVSNYELRCESIPGRVNPKGSSRKYIYDVRTQSPKPIKNN